MFLRTFLSSSIAAKPLSSLLDVRMMSPSNFPNNPLTMAKPMPLLEPVTTATFVIFKSLTIDLRSVRQNLRLRIFYFEAVWQQYNWRLRNARWELDRWCRNFFVKIKTISANEKLLFCKKKNFFKKYFWSPKIAF